VGNIPYSLSVPEHGKAHTNQDETPSPAPKPGIHTLTEKNPRAKRHHAPAVQILPAAHSNHLPLLSCPQAVKKAAEKISAAFVLYYRICARGVNLTGLHENPGDSHASVRAGSE